REPAPPMYVIRGSGGFGRPPGGCSRRGDAAGLLRGRWPLAMTVPIASGPLAPRNDSLVRGHHPDRLAGEQSAGSGAGLERVLARSLEAHLHVVGLADAHRLPRHAPRPPP